MAMAMAMAMAIAVLSGFSLANTLDPVPARMHQAAGFQSIQLGAYKITALHDGNVLLRPTVFNQNLTSATPENQFLSSHLPYEETFLVIFPE